MPESILLFLCAGPVVVILAAMSGAIAGFAMMKTAQKSAPYITNSDVAAVTRAWATGFGLGGLIAFLFLAIVDYMAADFIRSAFYLTAVLAMIGTSGGLIGVRAMFRRVAK